MEAAPSSSDPCVHLSSNQTAVALPEPQRASEVAEEPVHPGECLLRVPLYKGKCRRGRGWGVLAWLPSRGGHQKSGGWAREKLQSGQQSQLFFGLCSCRHSSWWCSAGSSLVFLHLVVVTENWGKADPWDLPMVLSLKPGFPSVKDL